MPFVIKEIFALLIGAVFMSTGITLWWLASELQSQAGVATVSTIGLLIFLCGGAIIYFLGSTPLPDEDFEETF